MSLDIRKSYVNTVLVLIASFCMPLILIAGCGKDSPTKPPVVTPTVASVTVNPASALLEVGGTQRFTASARASDGSTVSGVTFSWSSNNTSVVTINASGVATAVSAGTSTIRATGNGVSSSPVTVTVTQPPVTRITVSPSSAQQMNVGEQRTFTATAFTAGGSERDDVTFTWSSSDDTVVSINASGLATAIGAGTATITAATGGVTSSPVTVTVSEPPPMVASVTVSPPMVSIEVGESQQFEATALTSDGTTVPDVTFTWTSSDTTVATIDTAGLAWGLSAGSVAITASVGAFSNTAMLMVSVPPPVVSSVTVSPPTESIVIGETQQFEAMAFTSEGMAIPGVVVTWTSSDMMVATIDGSGLATGVGAGEVEITATVDDVSGTAMLMVAEPPPVVSTISLTPSAMTVLVGGMFQLSATALTSEGMEVPDVTFSWMSDDNGVASVDDTGMVTAIAAGTAMITASADGVTSMPATVIVEELPPEVASVTVDVPTAMLVIGETLQLMAVAQTSESLMIGGLVFEWSSDDLEVATVDMTGLVTAVGAGTANITATVDGVSSDPVMVLVSEPPPVVNTVTVGPVGAEMATVEIGMSIQLSAAALTSDDVMIPDETFTWSSSDEFVATVTQTGLATGVGAGEATISATADSVTGMVTLTVTEPPKVVDRVEVSPSSPSIDEGDTQQFTAVAYTADDEEIESVGFTWESSDTSVATIDSNGLATGVRAGSSPTQVTITALVDGKEDSATLTVEPVISSITVRPSSATINEGSIRRFRATAYTSYNVTISNVSFSWSSSNPSVATVSSSGLARGVSVGTATIRARAGGRTGSGTLRVTEPPPLVVSTIEVSPSSASIDEGGMQQFTATAKTSDGRVVSGVSISWDSGNEPVATIDGSSGLATGVRAGATPTQVTITASAMGESGTATLTVRPVIDRVEVTPSSATIDEGGDTQQFSATAYTSYGVAIQNVPFSWSSSNESVATVNSSTGEARGVRAGSSPTDVTITASVGDKSGMATLTVRPVIDRVEVTPSSATIDEGGDTQQFSATAYTSYGVAIQNVPFSWSSSNESVATVSSSGRATGERAGATRTDVNITASAGGKSGTAMLAVMPVISSVEVSPSTASIEEGETQQFSAAAETSYGVTIQNVPFTWSSSSTSTATINPTTGVARGVNAGMATITARAGGRSDTAMLTVTEPPPPTVNRVSVNPSSPSITEGSTQNFTATAYDADDMVVSGKTFTWMSSNTTVATINSSSGLATGVDAGSVTITATTDGVSGMATLTVTEPTPTLRSRSGTISGRNSYSAGGSVTLSEVSGGRLKLEITGLSTPSGAPDVYVALYTSSNIDWGASDSLPSGARSFGEVSRQSGTKSWTFTPGTNQDIDSWSHLILHCRLIDREVGSASLSN